MTRSSLDDSRDSQVDEHRELIYVDKSFARPEENLALDEALLEICDGSVRGGKDDRAFLRLWESPSHFVVLGVSGRVDDDVKRDNCARDRVPILRRASGGGTVVQGPGCLNLAIVLPLSWAGELVDVMASYRYIIERSITSLEGAGLRGSSDLALGDVKFGGSAQKRTARAILHHATLLHSFDLERIPRYLEEPKKRPDYREDRSHLDFVTNLPLDVQDIKQRLQSTWNARPDPDFTAPDLRPFIEKKYGSSAWNERF